MGALAGKVAIITGAARGQGEAHARRFASEGAKVVLTDVRTDLGEALAAEIGEAARFVAHDVGDEAGWNAVIGLAESEFGGIDILVNNAGIVAFGSVTDTDAAELDRVLRINAMGAIGGMRLVVPAMRRRGGGSIINVSSIAGLRGVRGMFAYSVSKWALRGASRSAAQDLAPENIRVNVVLPGLIDTPILPDGAAAAAPKEGLFRAIQPIEVARVVWEAYSSDRLHWYVPPEMVELDHAATLNPEDTRDRMAAGTIFAAISHPEGRKVL